MPANRNPIATEYGRLYGRDCIFLDEQIEDKDLQTLSLVGDINGPLCEIPVVDKYIPYVLCFIGVVSWSSITIDASDWDWESCFDQLTESTLLKKYDPNNSANLKHYVVQTYDDVFEIICTDFTLTLQQPFAA